MSERVCLPIEWHGNGLFIPRGEVTPWVSVIERPSVAAIRRLGVVSIGEFTDVYEIETAERYGGQRTTAQYLVGSGT